MPHDFPAGQAILDEVAAEAPDGMLADDAAILRLARLDGWAYERCREDVAKAHGVRVAILDRRVDDKRAALRVTRPDGPDVGSALLNASAETAAEMKLNALSPGMGVRLAGDPTAWQVERIDPEDGRVRIRQIPDPSWKSFPGVRIESPPGMWIPDPQQLTRERAWDDPARAGVTFSKALDQAQAGADLAARREDLKTRARRRITVERAALVAGPHSGKVTPYDASLAEALLIRFETKMGI